LPGRVRKKGSARPLSLLILENPWTSRVDDRTSVVPFLEGALSDFNVTLYSRPFYRLPELRLWLRDFRGSTPCRRRRALYIAAHGHRGRLAGLPDGSAAINFVTLTRALQSVGAVDGVFLGCCHIGSPANAMRLLRPRRRTGLCRWVAGYRYEVDWLDSTLVDVIFWRNLLEDPRRDPWAAAIATYQHFPRARDFGFAVFTRHGCDSWRDSLGHM
jgi:hypothetical protein